MARSLDPNAGSAKGAGIVEDGSSGTVGFHGEAPTAKPAGIVEDGSSGTADYRGDAPLDKRVSGGETGANKQTAGDSEDAKTPARDPDPGAAAAGVDIVTGEPIEKVDRAPRADAGGKEDAAKDDEVKSDAPNDDDRRQARLDKDDEGGKHVDLDKGDDAGKFEHHRAENALTANLDDDPGGDAGHGGDDDPKDIQVDDASDDGGDAGSADDDSG